MTREIVTGWLSQICCNCFGNWKNATEVGWVVTFTQASAVVNKLILSIVMISLTFTSCVNELNFEEPQPAGKRNENRFKKRFQGTYVCLDDSASVLHINRDQVIREWLLIAELTRTEVDTNDEVQWDGDLLHVKGYAEPFVVQWVGDTIRAEYRHQDTLFQVNNNHLLRYFKGFYFMNFRQPSGLWTVQVLSQNRKGHLNLRQVYATEEDITKLQEMTTVEEVTNDEGAVVDFKVKPSRKQLKEILNSGLFKQGADFQKIKS